MRVPAILLLLACLAIAACREDDDQPADNDPTIPAGFERVNGTERIGWDQQAADSQELATIRYLVFVDESAGREIQNVTCSSGAGPSGFTCSGALPPLTAGEHLLKLASFIEADGARVESAPSPVLRVFVVASTTRAASATPRTVRFPQEPTAPERFRTTTADGVEIQVDVVAEGLREPTDLAATSDGAVWIAERAGLVWVFRSGRLLPTPSVTLADAVTATGGGLLALAADPEFGTNRFIYLVYTTEAGFRLARFRAVGDTLGDRAILLDGIPSSANPSAALRFGLDLQLYLGLDVAGDPRRAGDLGSFNGKVLRLNRDATTPRDQPGLTPIFISNVSAPRGMGWDMAGSRIWVADDTPDATGQLHVVALARGTGAGASRGMTTVRYNLPDAAAPRGLAVYRSDLLAPLRGNVLVATEESSGDASILRIRLDAASGGSIAGTERLLRGSIDSARAIEVSDDGVIYLCTRDALVTLTPAQPQ